MSVMVAIKKKRGAAEAPPPSEECARLYARPSGRFPFPHWRIVKIPVCPAGLQSQRSPGRLDPKLPIKSHCLDLSLFRGELESHGKSGPAVAPQIHTPRGPYALTETICGEAVERSVGGVRV
jgi:hypothetical protein